MVVVCFWFCLFVCFFFFFFFFDEIKQSVKIGDPLNTETLMGPVHTASAVKEYEEGIAEIVKQGGKVLYGGYPTNKTKQKQNKQK